MSTSTETETVIESVGNDQASTSESADTTSSEQPTAEVESVPSEETAPSPTVVPTSVSESSVKEDKITELYSIISDGIAELNKAAHFTAQELANLAKFVASKL